MTNPNGNVATIGTDDAVATLPEYSWQEFDPGRVFLALAVIEKGEDGGFVSFSPSLPGAVSQGDTVEEALKNLHEALAGCIESYVEAGESIPWVKLDGLSSVDDNVVMAKWIDVSV